MDVKRYAEAKLASLQSHNEINVMPENTNGKNKFTKNS